MTRDEIELASYDKLKYALEDNEKLLELIEGMRIHLEAAELIYNKAKEEFDHYDINIFDNIFNVKVAGGIIREEIDEIKERMSEFGKDNE